MISTIILMILSLLLEGILTNLIMGFIPFFMIAALVISSNKISRNIMVLIAFIFGFIYDLIYTDMFILNALIFGLISLFITCNNRNNYFKNLIIYYFTIFIYIITMLLYTSVVNHFNISEVSSVLLTSLAINTVYFSLFYLLFIGIKRVFCNTKNKKSYF